MQRLAIWGVAWLWWCVAGHAVGWEDEDRTLESFVRHALTHVGNPESGRKLFFEDLRTRCSQCHRVAGRGGEVGPDLTVIGGKYDRPHLVESILRPSQYVLEGYQTSVILTKDGAIYAGIVKAEDDSSVTLLDQAGRKIEVARREIERREVAKVSLMPSGLHNWITPEEFTDLVAFLESLRPDTLKMGAGVKGPIQLPPGFQLDVIATGLSGATAMEIAPDGRIFVCEQQGTVRVIQQDRLVDEPVVKIPVECYWERGLIGVTVGPTFPDDPWLYVVYVASQPFPHHRISRLKLRGNQADLASEQVLLRGDDQSRFGGNVPAGHQGGGIHFGADGMLYVGIGDQTAGRPAQRLDALQGKILRLNPDGTIPKDNPFYEKTSGKYRAIWAIGCRNPFTFAIRRTDGLMLINDVGGKYEEINVGIPGANYGWPLVEHGPTDRPGITGPIYWYPQSSINGGDFAPASHWPPAMRGKYFFADFVQGWIRYIDPAEPAEVGQLASGLRRPVDLRFAPDGSLYVLIRNAWVVDDKFQPGTGSVLRIRYRPAIP